MQSEELDQLLVQLCEAIGLADSSDVINRRLIEVDGFECSFDISESDPDALYLLVNFGFTTAGRTLKLFRAMLEANLLVYAQDQAQLGIDPETGTILLIIRIVVSGDIDGYWLADTLSHYSEHGRYWREQLFTSEDEMFDAMLSGDYIWMRV